MSDESDLVAALRALANVRDESTFGLRWKDQMLRVDYSGGSSSSLAISAEYDASARAKPPMKESAYRDSATSKGVVAIRPMNIQLRPETSGDVDDKIDGTSHEWQTGDADFDRDVYVDTPTVSPHVLASVLSAPAREGARALIKLGLKQIVIDDMFGRVNASMTEFASRTDQSIRAREMADAFVLMLSGFPPLVRSDEKHAGKPLGCTMLAGGVLASILGFGLPAWFFLVAGALDCTESSSDGEGSSLKDGCGGGAIVGIAVGFVAAITTVALVRGPLKRALGGRSDSGARVTKGVLIAGVLTFAVVMLATSGIVMAHR